MIFAMGQFVQIVETTVQGLTVVIRAKECLPATVRIGLVLKNQITYVLNEKPVT